MTLSSAYLDLCLGTIGGGCEYNVFVSLDTIYLLLGYKTIMME